MEPFPELQLPEDWEHIKPPHDNPVWRTLADEYSSFIVFLKLLVFQAESVVVAIAAAGWPCFFYYYELNGHRLAFTLSWTLVSLAVIFQLSFTLAAVYKRREAALVSMASFKSNSICILLAHRDWDWYNIPKDPSELSKSGRSTHLRPDHARQVFDILSGYDHVYICECI